VPPWPAWQGERVHLTRRNALTSAGLALIAACTPGKPPTPAPIVDPDDALKASAVAREQALLSAYDNALTVLPTLAARLAPLRADHAEHLAALGVPPSPGASAASPGPSVASPSSAASSLPSSPPTGAASTPAGQTPQAVLQRLAELERTAATGHATGALTASRRLAAILASLAACESSHLVAL
jgi:hypothetical protein